MKQKWIPELDGLRVLMIFTVSWYHIWQQSWLTPVIGGYSLDYLLRSGYVWVDGTVLMSAFLLYRPYAQTRLRGAPLPDPAAFYRRRARRILPGYYTILALTFFGVCLPWHLYASPQYLVKDTVTHLTFLFPFFRDTYVMTPLGAACWTLAIEVQAYALFPWMARASLKHPGRTFGAMLAVCFGFRAWCLWSLDEFNMVVNQLANFLDLYALGCGLALAYETLRAREEEKGKLFRGSRWAATGLFLLAFWGLLRMLRIQRMDQPGAGHGGAGQQLSGHPAEPDALQPDLRAAVRRADAFGPLRYPAAEEAAGQPGDAFPGGAEHELLSGAPDRDRAHAADRLSLQRI